MQGCQRSGKSQGKTFFQGQGKVREFCDECPVMKKNPCIILMLCDIAPITVSWEENMCVLVTVY